MVLNDSLRTATLEELKQINILSLDSYARQNGKTLNFLRNQGIIDDSSLDVALEVAVLEQARRDFKIMTAKGRPYIIYADHVGSPECLAYALKRGKFSEEEIRRIPFDHGDTAETFPERHGRENLLSILREGLLTPRILPKFKGEYWPNLGIGWAS